MSKSGSWPTDGGNSGPSALQNIGDALRLARLLSF